MATRETKRISDGWIELSAGIDSGRSPNLIGRNQVSFAINTTFRGAWPQPRPGWRKIELAFDSGDVRDAFESARFQTAGGYVTDNGLGSLISMHSGRVFRIKLGNGTFQSTEISIAGDWNAPNREQAWNAQGQNYFVIQDDQSKAFIFDGASARRAGPRELPVGRQITYYMGRFWIARGRDYVASDIVFGANGTPALGYRDSILKMIENSFLSGGGSFGVPVEAGEITAIKPIANINTALGQGELIVYTGSSAFATLVPQDREQWANTSQPIQRMIQLANGAYSQTGVVNVNEDLYSRTHNGILPLSFSVRNSGQAGNTTISGEMNRILLNDAPDFLKWCSGVEFDNRFLMTASPSPASERGVYHRCLAVLDFDLLTSMRDRQAPAWEGIWTGLNILQLVTVKHHGVPHCFAYVLSADQNIELWELTKDAKFDYNGQDDVRIKWSIESRSMDFGSKFEMTQLESGDLFFDRLTGQVDFDVDFRPDSYPCWIDWDNWQECSKFKLCEGEFGVCPTLPNYKEQYRPKRQLKMPTDAFDPIRKEKYRTGYEHQVRLNIEGFCRAKQLRINGSPIEELPHGRQL